MEVEKVKEMLGDSHVEQIKKDIAIQKAVDFVVENAKEGKTAAKSAKAKKEDQAE